jgi:hypothetical protein
VRHDAEQALDDRELRSVLHLVLLGSDEQLEPAS